MSKKKFKKSKTHPEGFRANVDLLERALEINNTKPIEERLNKSDIFNKGLEYFILIESVKTN